MQQRGLAGRMRAKQNANGTACPVTRAVPQGREAADPNHRWEHARGIGQSSTVRFGWFLGDKTAITVDSIPCRAQVGLNLTITGSKDAE